MRKITKLTKIKYLALISLIYSAISPVQVMAQPDQSVDSIIGIEKPALLALAEIQPLVYSSQQTEPDLCEFGFIFGSTLIGQTNPNVGPLTNCQYSLNGNSRKILTVKQGVIVTAYSSTPDQTDASPFITAQGTYVRDGIVACNFLRFGTKIRLPEVYGNKVFVVEDRMALRNSHKVDIWMPSRDLALQFGVKRLTVEILE